MAVEYKVTFTCDRCEAISEHSSPHGVGHIVSPMDWAMVIYFDKTMLLCGDCLGKLDIWKGELKAQG